MEQQLLVICRKFLADQKIRAPESCYQMDHIVEAAPELVEQVCNLVGYWDDDTQYIAVDGSAPVSGAWTTPNSGIKNMNLRMTFGAGFTGNGAREERFAGARRRGLDDPERAGAVDQRPGVEGEREGDGVGGGRGNADPGRRSRAQRAR